jgi:hypothetical protein
MFLLPEKSTPTLGTTQGPFPRGKAARVRRSSLASIECLGEEWSYISTDPIRLHGMH